MGRVQRVIFFFAQWFQIHVEDYKITTEDSVPVFDYFFFLHILFQIIQDILTGSPFLWRNFSQVYSDSYYQRRDQLNSMHRLMPELIQEVIELTGILCFLFCSTPRFSNKMFVRKENIIGN